MSQYAVVGCQECHGHWIAEELGAQDTVQCPQCGHTRATANVRRKAEAEEWEVACELRSRILASRAGRVDSFVENWDDYGVLADEIDQALPDISCDGPPLFSDRWNSEVEELLDHDHQRNDFLKERAEAYLDRRFGTSPVEVTEDDRDRSLEAIENAAGSMSVVGPTEVSADTRLSADSPPTTLWERIASSDTFQESLVAAVREILASSTSRPPGRELFDAGVTAADGGYARILSALDLPPENDRHQEALDFVAQIGQDGVTQLGRRPLEDIVSGPLAALDAAEITPTIAVHIGQEFRDPDRDPRRGQREDTLWILTALSQVADLQLAMTDLTGRWLHSEHQTDLPTSFSESFTASCPSDKEIEANVETALEEVDIDGRPLRILRDLENEPSNTLSYGEIASSYEVSPGRISQHLTKLEDFDLISRFGSQKNRRAELNVVGSEFLAVLDEEFGKQQRLDELFSECGGHDGDGDGRSNRDEQSDRDRDEQSDRDGDEQSDRDGDEPVSERGQSSQRDVLARPHERAAPPHRTRYLGWAEHHASAAVASNGQIVTVPGPVPSSDDATSRRTRFVSYDEDRDEVVVAVHATTPMQYIVSTAIGLASPRLFDKALPLSRLEDIDDPPAILRDARCLGALSSEALDDPEVFRDQLVEWGETIAEMTTKLRNEDYDNRNRFCGEILRAAHGLAGTIVHLLDIAGVDVVREIRVPSITDDQMESLARTVAISTAIQSKYGAFASYRQLFEDREDKRRTALVPKVDAEDPLGEFIGSLVIRGPAANRVGYHVEGQLESPAPLHDDAPEFAVKVPVTRPGREAYTAAANRKLAQKNMRVIPEAVTLLQALARTPWAVTEALHRLKSEDNPRTIRLDEVRVALATLDPHRLLGDVPPSVSQAVAALLRSAQPLSREALCEKADISSRSLRRHLEVLLALDLVRETDRGYRLQLPFSESERGKTVVPDAVAGSTRVEDLVFELALAVVDRKEAGRLADPDDPLSSPFYDPGLDVDPLRRHLPESQPYLSIALALCNRSEQPSRTVAFGPTLEQASLQDTTAAAG